MTDENEAQSDEEATSTEEVAAPDPTEDPRVSELQARLAGKDKALTAALKRATAAEASVAQRAEEARKAQMTDEQRRDDEVANLKRELEEERASRAIESLKAKYPDAAESLDDAVLTSMPEDKLAALQTRLGGSPEPDRMETNGSARTTARKEPEDPLSDEAYRRLAEEAFPDSVHPK